MSYLKTFLCAAGEILISPVTSIINTNRFFDDAEKSFREKHPDMFTDNVNNTGDTQKRKIGFLLGEAISHHLIIAPPALIGSFAAASKLKETNFLGTENPVIFATMCAIGTYSGLCLTGVFINSTLQSYSQSTCSRNENFYPLRAWCKRNLQNIT